MGGVFFDGTTSYLWRHAFPLEVQDRLVSTDCPNGTVTNSDLEHAGLLAQLAVMASVADLTYATVENLSDNTPAVSTTLLRCPASLKAPSPNLAPPLGFAPR